MKSARSLVGIALLAAALVVPASPALAGSPVPDVAEIRCAPEGTGVVTPTARVQGDGVHAHLINDTDVLIALRLRPMRDSVMLEPHTTSDVRFAKMPPGAYRITCVPRYDRDAIPITMEPLELVDPDGLYRPARVSCITGGAVQMYVDYAQGARGRVGNPVRLVEERLRHLQPGDVVAPAGYPDVEPTGKSRPVSVTREGRTVFVAWLETFGHGWLVGSTQACVDDGVKLRLW